MSEIKPCPSCSDIYAITRWAYITDDGTTSTEKINYCPKCGRDLRGCAQPDHVGGVADMIASPLEEWGEDYGDCLWWAFPIEEPPYCGNPLCSDWPGYHTHFTRLVCPEQPKGETK